MDEYVILKESIDLDGVGLIEIESDFDNDEYNEWLDEEGLENNSENLKTYISDCVGFQVERFDNDVYHHIDYCSCDYEDLEDALGESFASRIVDDILKNDSSRLEISEIYDSQKININNPDELNDIAMKMFNHGEYYKDCRGYILTNGVTIYTDMEHNMVSQINGVGGTYDFIRLGNIRVLSQSIDLAKKPTHEQRMVLRRVISSYSDDVLYLDIFNKDGSVCGCEYNHPNYNYVIGEIDRYFDEGIKPSGKDFYESRKHLSLIITESQYRRIFKESATMRGFADSAELLIDGDVVADYSFKDSTAYPFTIVGDNLYIGEKSSTHIQICANNNISEFKGIHGRIWVSAKSEEFNHAIVLFWGDVDENVSKYNYKDKIYELANKLKVNPNKIVIGIDVNNDYSFKLEPLSKWNGFIHTISSNEKGKKEMHLLNPIDKLKQTQGFRDVRDKKIGKKLTNRNDDEMPLAKYHNLIYQESKI